MDTVVYHVSAIIDDNIKLTEVTPTSCEIKLLCEYSKENSNMHRNTKGTYNFNDHVTNNKRGGITYQEHL